MPVTPLLPPEPAVHRPHWRAPTLTASVALFTALVVAVARQPRAVSTGVRWTSKRTMREIEVEPLEPMELGVFTTGTEGGSAWIRWVATALLLLLALILLRLLFTRMMALKRRARTTTVGTTDSAALPTAEADARVLATGLAAAMEVLSIERDYGNAVVKAWQGLEDAAALAGLARQPAETASEFTARILFRSQRSAAAIAALLTLYQRVRFGEYTPNATDIASAHRALTILKSLWEADLPERRRARTGRQ
jgi:ABC-type amino acid transport substrate-binding protein